METKAKIYVAGHRGLVGSAIVRRLKKDGYNNIITRNHSELDLTDQKAVHNFFIEEKPDYVFLCAAKVGGIQANRSALDEFLYINTMIECNVIKESQETGVKKFCFMGSGCIYPRDCPQPIKEEYLLTSPLEITNEGYALAKITGLKLCEYYNARYPNKTQYISVMPCNLYGPGDNYHPENSHVIPGLIRKFHEAKQEKKDEVILWGTGRARREFLHIDDVADAVLFLMQRWVGERGPKEGVPGISWINIGLGKDLYISEVADQIAKIVGFTGKISYDCIHPDGTPRKILDISRLRKLGWKPNISFSDGLEKTYADYIKNYL